MGGCFALLKYVDLFLNNFQQGGKFTSDDRYGCVIDSFPTYNLQQTTVEMFCKKTWKISINNIKDIYRFNPFPHTTILQQTTLNVFCQNIGNLYN